VQWTVIRTQRELDFKEAVNSRWDAFRIEVKRAEDLQDTVVAFFEASQDVGRDQFDAFASNQPYVGFQAISFARHVPDAKRAAFERTMRAEKWPVSRIWEVDAEGRRRGAGQTSDYFPVTYLYPATGNLPALGFDLMSEPRRKRALLAAMETGKTVRTAPIRLVQDPEHWAFLVFKPVYTRRETTASSDKSEPRLIGVVSAVYEYGAFLNAVLTRTPIAGHHIALFDLRQPSSPVYVHYSRALPAESPDLDRPLAVLASAPGARTVTVTAMRDDLAAVFFSADVGVTWWKQINKTIFATLAIGLLLTAALVLKQVRAYRLTIRLHRATEDLKFRKEEAETANAAKSRFLAAASHDLRQPMYALGLFADSLQHEIGDPERAAPLIRRLQQSIGVLSGMLDALLDVSGLEAGTHKTAVQDFAVHALLQRVQDIYTPLALVHGLRFSVVNSTAWIRSDPALLARIVENLVSNAIKYTRCGGVIVGCRRRINGISIEVWDSGAGIPSAHQAEIFDEFFQLDNPERDRSKGLGLGLAIVDRIARLLNHRIRIKSVPDRGSMFAVDVPYGDKLQTVAVPHRIEEPLTCFADLRVAVIDDDADIVDATQQLLERWGCVVIGARSEAEVLKSLSRLSLTPGLVICDYQLREGADGLSVIHKMRLTYGETIPAIVVSGNPTSDLSSAAHEGSIEMLQKPVAPARLRAAMQHLLLHDRVLDTRRTS
jgi:signal transduction histidine kinase/ActR/RegA family two-component response regulator